ncbi:hypothetical protein GCM10011297_29880 [Bacterioplanes sanyensis]|nr:hypothetical protein GCM10011297_29880 [Bacterioplanes sanyensis]
MEGDYQMVCRLTLEVIDIDLEAWGERDHKEYFGSMTAQYDELALQQEKLRQYLQRGGAHCRSSNSDSSS